MNDFLTVVVQQLAISCNNALLFTTLNVSVDIAAMVAVTLFSKPDPLISGTSYGIVVTSGNSTWWCVLCSINFYFHYLTISGYDIT
jgi:hypothetical protein